MPDKDHLITDLTEIKTFVSQIITDPDTIEATLKRLPAITPDMKVCLKCTPPVPLTVLSSYTYTGDGQYYRCDACGGIWTFDD